MIAVLPQTEHLQRNANGLTAETQLQLAAGCFIAAPPCGPWVRPYPALSITTKQVSNSSIDQGGGKRRGNSATPILLRLTLYRWRFRIFDQESSRPRVATILHTAWVYESRDHSETGVASFFAGPLSCQNAATAILVPTVKLDFVGLCRALDLVGLCHFVGLRRGSFRSKLAASPA